VPPILANPQPLDFVPKIVKNITKSLTSFPGSDAMHVLLVPFGSHGDVHPFIGLGQALRERGHRVTFLINEYFGGLVRGRGFEMVPVGEASIFEEALRNPDLWDPKKGFSAVAGGMLEHAKLLYPMIADLYEPGETVAVGGTMAFGVRLAQEKLGLPAATVHLQPGVLHSNYETPAYPGLQAPRWWPTWFKRFFFDGIYRFMVDPLLVPGLNALRAELELPPIRDVMRGWLHSPRLVLGFFPGWFGPPQPDWPPPTPSSPRGRPRSPSPRARPTSRAASSSRPPPTPALGWGAAASS
jgi:rhamnosyltransferase subunit B